MAELKKEIKAGQLGDTAVKFAQGVIAGFGQNSYLLALRQLSH